MSVKRARFKFAAKCVDTLHESRKLFVPIFDREAGSARMGGMEEWEMNSCPHPFILPCFQQQRVLRDF